MHFVSVDVGVPNWLFLVGQHTVMQLSPFQRSHFIVTSHIVALNIAYIKNYGFILFSSLKSINVNNSLIHLTDARRLLVLVH